MTNVAKTFTLPKTVEDISARLATIDQLVIAREWERAAIVYAFTTATKGRPKKDGEDSGRMPIKKFAALGIRGLSSHVTVGHYRRAWSDAMEAGAAEEPVPGKSVAFPQGIEFPKMHADAPAASPAEPVAVESTERKYTKEELHDLILADEDPGFTGELRDTMAEQERAKKAGAIRKPETGKRRTSTGERLEAVPSGRELSEAEQSRKDRARRAAKGSSGGAEPSKEASESDDPTKNFSSICGQLKAVLDALLDTLDPGELSATVRAAYVAELQDVEQRAAAIRERLEAAPAGKGGKRRAS